MSFDRPFMSRTVWPGSTHTPLTKSLANTHGRASRQTQTSGLAKCFNCEPGSREITVLSTNKAGSTEGDIFAQDELLIDFLEDWEEGTEQVDSASVHGSQEFISAQGMEYPSRDFMTQSPSCEIFEPNLHHSNPIEIPNQREIGIANSAGQSIGQEILGSDFSGTHLRIDSMGMKNQLSGRGDLSDKEYGEVVAPHILLARMNKSSSKMQCSCRVKGLACLRQRTALLAMTGYLAGYTEMGQRPQKFPARIC